MNTNQSSASGANRRRFLQSSASLLAAATIPYQFTAASPSKAIFREKRRHALIGSGGNGTRTCPVAQQFVDLVALCDVDANRLQAANTLLAQGKADTYADYREVLSRDDIDVVQICTPDHWHTKILVEAMLAGKDAYCEKPLTLTIDEGKLIRDVQKQTGQVIQVGTQQRSSFDRFNKAIAIIADGRIGKLKRLTLGIGAAGWSPPIPIVDVPEGLDWERWLGPGPKMPYRYKRNPKVPATHGFTNGHIQFRWWYEHSGGKLTDWGAHHVDIAMLAIAAAGQSNDPISVEGTAKHNTEFKDGNPVQSDRYNTAMKFDLDVKFAGSDVVMNIRHDVDNGILFEGEHGRMFVNRGKLTGAPVEDLKDNPLPEDAIQKVYRGMPMVGNDRPAHWANFVQAMEDRTLPISDVHSHMKMLNVCHIAGICCRLGRKINWDQSTESIVGDELAASMMKRPYREGFEIDMGT